MMRKRRPANLLRGAFFVVRMKVSLVFVAFQRGAEDITQ